MARYECERCHAVCNTTDGPHLCKDLKKRLARQEKAMGKVRDILLPYFNGSPYTLESVSLDIVRAISGLDLEDT